MSPPAKRKASFDDGRPDENKRRECPSSPRPSHVELPKMSSDQGRSLCASSQENHGHDQARPEDEQFSEESQHGSARSRNVSPLPAHREPMSPRTVQPHESEIYSVDGRLSSLSVNQSVTQPHPEYSVPQSGWMTRLMNPQLVDPVSRAPTPTPERAQQHDSRLRAYNVPEVPPGLPEIPPGLPLRGRRGRVQAPPGVQDRADFDNQDGGFTPGDRYQRDQSWVVNQPADSSDVEPPRAPSPIPSRAAGVVNATLQDGSDEEQDEDKKIKAAKKLRELRAELPKRHPKLFGAGRMAIPQPGAYAARSMSRMSGISSGSETEGPHVGESHRDSAFVPITEVFYMDGDRSDDPDAPRVDGRLHDGDVLSGQSPSDYIMSPLNPLKHTLPPWHAPEVHSDNVEDRRIKYGRPYQVTVAQCELPHRVSVCDNRPDLRTRQTLPLTSDAQVLGTMRSDELKSIMFSIIRSKFNYLHPPYLDLYLMGKLDGLKSRQLYLRSAGQLERLRFLHLQYYATGQREEAKYVERQLDFMNLRAVHPHADPF